MNIAQIMKQAQEMQSKMAEMQQRLAEAEVQGQSGGGMVTVTMTGKSEVKKLKIDPKIVDPADVDMLEDLIVAACNDARQKAEAHMASETEKMMGGMNLPPGMKLPF